jgi:hypothetical protein
MRRFFRPTILIPAVAGFLVGITADILADYLAATSLVARLTLFGLTGLLLLMALVYQEGRRTTGRFGAPVVIRTLVDRYTQSRHGLIAIVSLYNPKQKSPASHLTRQQRLEAAKKLDYQTLDLEQSNLKVLIAGIEAHAPRLAHCWLIATQSDDPATSSLTYVPVLEKYLSEVKGLKCRFHSGERYALVIEKDDALVAERARRLVDDIFKEAGQEKVNLRDQEIVADITGGFRSIPLGVIMACLDKRRMVQFVGTRYDDQAQPTEELVPILFEYAPEIFED